MNIITLQVDSINSIEFVLCSIHIGTGALLCLMHCFVDKRVVRSKVKVETSGWWKTPTKEKGFLYTSKEINVYKWLTYSNIT